MSLPQLLRRLRHGRPIIVVSGLPRSGTSMMMRMLEAGGLPLLTDQLRAADESNPHGYFEFEQVKQLDKPGANTSWLATARGRAVKIVSLLLTWLPEIYDYRVVLMQRDVAEVIASQQKMLAARGESTDVREMERMGSVYAEHLEKVLRFLGSRGCFTTLRVDYRSVIDHPEDEARRVARFIGERLDIGAMAGAVDSRLYRNRART